MARFAYTARDRSGKTLSADLDAPSRKDALRLLSARGLQIVSVAEQGGSPGVVKPKRVSAQAAAAAAENASLFSAEAGSAPKRSDCLPFLESMHDLISSGLSAGEAVRLLSVRIKEPRQRAL